MTEHILKTVDHYWHAVERGDKNFEVRRDDRGFQRGDVLVLRRLTANKLYFELKNFRSMREGKEEYYDLRRRITYILTGGQLGIEPGYVVLGLENDVEKLRQ
jgi:hypothetical protein